MAGGLYRSANAARGGGPPPRDGATLIGTGLESGTGAEPPADTASGSTASRSAVMALGSLVSRGTGFLRTLVLSAALGGALVGDAYTTAQIFPGTVYEFLLGGVLSSVVVPVLVRRRKSDADGGEAYAQRLLTLVVLALGAATLLAMLAAPLLALLYGSDKNGPEFNNLITALSYLMLPMIFFTGLAAVIGAILNTRGHFAAPMWTPILNNLVIIAAVGLYILIYGAELVQPEDMTPGRILLIGGGTLLGVMTQAAGLVPALRRVGFRWRWRFDFRNLDLRRLAGLGGWTFCYVVVNQISLLILFNLLNRASGEDKAGPIIYNNVYLLLWMAHGIIAVSIITALMPRLSAAAADGRHADLAADLSRGVRTVAAMLAPVAVCYAVLAKPIGFALFNHGAFTDENATATALVLLAAGIALLPLGINQLLTVSFYAQQDTRTPALVNLPAVGIRLLAQLLVFAVVSAQFAGAGMMLGNGISYAAAAIGSALLLQRRIGSLDLRGIGRTLGKVMLAGLGAALVGLLVLALLPGDDSPTLLEAVLRLTLGGAAIGTSYLALAMLLRLNEVNDVINLVRRKLGR